ncbi:MAG: tRNA-dihydrouridine synthase family protein [Clostridia bacterium]|nr:tRNA-dihydrouridine synthase family protein [Clostridia bacterium]
MKIGNLQINGDVVLAPIAGYSDVGFRAICAKQGAAITYTEMASAKGLYYDKAAKTLELLNTTDDERIKAVQLFGSEPFFISYAVKAPVIEKFDLIDINMGCPVPKIVKNNEGSALLNNIPLAKDIIKAAKDNTSKPVTVKMRLGFDTINAVEFALAMQEAGADLLTVHGRTRKEMYMGHSHWDEIAKVVKAVNIPVIANGDVESSQDYLDIKAQTGASGVMIARGALGNPNIFSQITGKEDRPIKDMMLEHIEIMRQFHNEHYVHANFKKHMACYCKGKRGNKEIKQRAFESKDLQEMINIIKESDIYD